MNGEQFIQVHIEETKDLIGIIANFNDLQPNLEDEMRQFRIKAMQKREYLLQEIDETIEIFNSYLNEMDNDREKWFSEQYIYDELVM